MTPLRKKIDQILQKHRIRLTKILRLNNRFLVARGKLQGQVVTFKILISRNPYEQNKFGQALIREAKFLEFLNQKGTPLIKQSINKIIDWQKTRQSWYIKNFLPGQSQKIEGSGWLMNKNFFNQKNLSWLTNFYHDLYQLSAHLPASLKKIFRASTLKNYESYIDWLNVITFSEIAKLPLKKELPRIKRFFINHRKIFDLNQIVINHFEPYADHLITYQGKVALIDWENVSYGDVAHDIAVVWSRAFEHPNWQKQLVKNFMPLTFFKELFRIHLIMQSLGNIRYFFDSPFHLDQERASLVIKILQKNIKLALNDQLG